MLKLSERENLAREIFLKRLPTEPLTDKNRAWYKSCAESAFEAADTFLALVKEQRAAEKVQPGDVLTYTISPFTLPDKETV